jgi:hypothetical protein
MMDINEYKKPHQIRIAVYMAWASLVLGMLSVPFKISEQNLAYFPPILGEPIYFIVAILVITLLSFSFIMYKISKGRNWARLIYLIVTVIGIYPSFSSLFESFLQSPIWSIFDLVIILLSIIPIYLLYSNPCSAWFKKS